MRSLRPRLRCKKKKISKNRRRVFALACKGKWCNLETYCRYELPPSCCVKAENLRELTEEKFENELQIIIFKQKTNRSRIIPSCCTLVD